MGQSEWTCRNNEDQWLCISLGEFWLPSLWAVRAIWMLRLWIRDCRTLFSEDLLNEWMNKSLSQPYPWVWPRRFVKWMDLGGQSSSLTRTECISCRARDLLEPQRISGNSFCGKKQGVLREYIRSSEGKLVSPSAHTPTFQRGGWLEQEPFQPRGVHV